MKKRNHEADLCDAALVAQSQDGERDAFSTLVHRHQSAACSVAYSICGDIRASEDLAQEAFLAAWQRLKEIKDAARFRAWICGIARNAALNFVRAKARKRETILDGERQTADHAALPDQAAITSEEVSILWSTLEKLPENYREPLVLFYREQQSVADVATALALSEDTAKQRLSRGRKLLRNALANKVVATLETTRPGSAFTIGVMSAIPPFAVGLGAVASASTVKAATAGGAGTIKGSAAIAGASVAGAMVSGAVGFFGFWIVRQYWKTNKMPKDIRKKLLAAFYVQLALSVLFSAFIVWFSLAGGYPLGRIGLSPALLLGGTIIAFIASVHALAIRAEKKTGDQLSKTASQPNQSKRYRSRLSFAGLPLLSIAYGPDHSNQQKRGRARGWIAIGDIAIGGIAIGNVSIGPIAIGTLSIGILSIGGTAIGLASLGAIAAGMLALGGLALGWHSAIGGCAVSSEAALGGLAVSTNQAAGQLPIAAKVMEASQLAEQDAWMHTAFEYGPYASWLPLLLISLLVAAHKKIRTIEPHSQIREN